jgi:hypothetical protein
LWKLPAGVLAPLRLLFVLPLLARLRGTAEILARPVFEVRVRILLTGTQPTGERVLYCVGAIVLHEPVSKARCSQSIADVSPADPPAGDHRTHAECGTVQIIVASALRGLGELGGDPVEGGLSVCPFARTIAAAPGAVSLLLGRRFLSRRLFQELRDARGYGWDGSALECADQVGHSLNDLVPPAIWQRRIGCDHVSAIAAHIDAGRQITAAVAECVAVLLEINVSAVTRRERGRRSTSVIFALLRQQQLLERGAAIGPAVTIAIENEQTTLCQIDSRECRWVLRPQRGDGLGVRGTCVAPFNERLLVWSARKYGNAGLGQAQRPIAIMVDHGL